MKLTDIKKAFDKDYIYSQDTREKGSDDLVFYWITQWGDKFLSESQLAFRGEFNILRKAGRGILADLASNPVQVDFEPVDPDRDDAADLADGLYRSECNNNTSIEAFSNAEQEAVVCGMAAWELYTEYESVKNDDNKQVIKRRPIYEANNTVFFDSNDKSLDKSNSTRCTKLTCYTEDGYKDLVHELTGEEIDEINPENFKQPEQSYTFPWVHGEGTSAKYYIGTHYHRELVETKVFTMQPPVGPEIKVYEDELEKKMDELIDSGYEITGEKTTKKWRVTKYIVSGAEILNGKMGPTDEDGDEERQGEVIAGEHIPIIPEFGEHAVVEGGEHWEGVTRLTKDPQRLRNFQMSYLADIVSKSPRPKPIFTPQQLAGHEDMYEINGPDNNFPYLLQNMMAEGGVPLPLGPVGVMPETPIPQALAASIQLSREAVEDVANPGLPKEYPNREVPVGTMQALQTRLDMQSMVYQQNKKHALRRDGEVWASMAAEINDVPRTVTVEAPDGKRSKIKMMHQVYDGRTGEIVTINDLYNTEFQVFSKISPSYMSQKEQTIDRLEKMLVSLPPTNPMYDFIMLKVLQLTDGTDFADVRDYVKKEMIIKGYEEPKTDEEKQMLAEHMQKAQEPSAEMVLAMAEDKKGQAQLLEQQRKGIEMNLNFQNKDVANQIDGFNAQTKRMDTHIDAEEAGAKINTEEIEAFGKQLDNREKLKELTDPAKMTNEELLAEYYT